MLAGIIPACTLQTGCAVIENIADNDTANVLIRSTIRVAAYLVAENNPELAPWVRDVATIIQGFDYFGQPKVVRRKLEGEIDGMLDTGDISQEELVLIYTLVDDAMMVYTRVWDSYQLGEGDDIPDDELSVLMETLGKAMLQGVLIAMQDDGVPASEPPIQATFSRAVLVIE